MKTLVTLVALAIASPAHGSIHSGHASAELLATSTTYEAAKPIQAAIRLKVDPGWHTYWTNPGEGGMKLGAEWVLPQGWSAGQLGWPVPIRFKTGDLAGFGYVDELVISVTLTPPAGDSKPATISVKLDWLTCNDKACIPGEAAPAIELRPGPVVASPSAAIIEKATAQVPQPVAGLQLEVSEEGKSLVLTLTAPTGTDPSTFATFPATTQVVDPSAAIGFGKSGGGWTAVVPRSEYLDGPPKILDLVLTGGGLPHPALVSWSRK